MELPDHLTSPSSIASSESSSPNRRTRFNRQTRREAIERRFGSKSRASQDEDDDDEKKEDVFSIRSNNPVDSPTTPMRQVESGLGSLTVKFPPFSSPSDGRRLFENGTVTTVSTATLEDNDGYVALHERVNDRLSTIDDGDSNRVESRRRPQHLYANEAEAGSTQYYRVAYRGVVSLLSAPEASAPRSGHYLSYGEVFASQFEIEIPSTSSSGPTLSPRPFYEDPNSSAPQQSTGSISNPLDLRKATSPPSLLSVPPLSCSSITPLLAVRVDQMLTGGYSVDASDVLDQTPRKSNNMHHSAPCPASVGRHLGYLFSRTKHIAIVERLSTTPLAETGTFHYKIMSSTPLPILSGPSFDAPRTKAMVLPGTVHEVSLRISTDPEGDGIWFLRLCHRRGWIADRKLAVRRGRLAQTVPVVKEIFAADVAASSFDDGSVSLSSLAVSSVSAPSIFSRRHRPPRRRRDASGENMDKTLPRQVVSTELPAVTRTPTKMSHRGCLNDSTLTPCSNVSILSDDSSVEHSTVIRSIYPASPETSTQSRRGPATSPDVSMSVSSTPSTVTCYLIRVTAPRGLKILDAPHFQVNNLIHHGSAPLATKSMLLPSSQANSGQYKTQSIFQSMSGRLGSSNFVNRSVTPAVFDPNTKSRVLPRGSLFEASKRMESNGAFKHGAGLIKLADKSGWAIVPKQVDLDEQYRNYNGGVAGIKEGEATMAFEEVGNAIVEPPSVVQSYLKSRNECWLRVTARAGVSVVCQPQYAADQEEDLSPSSSRGSPIAHASNHSSALANVKSQDSDVASSVGSAFLDAMFRTPKKREVGRLLGTSSKHRLDESTADSPMSCGICVEVEQGYERSSNHQVMEYARLKGGQGWIPMFKSGKPCASVVAPPELRFGSFWFRVQAFNGLKVRLGPSRKAPSIKSDEGVYFCFECGEFLRASEILTVFSDDGGEALECYAKLYRNRHARLHAGTGGVRTLSSLAAPAEWVQVYTKEESHLEECLEPPRIERHKDGWRYNAVPDAGVPIRLGPSFAAEMIGNNLLGGESVMINERVSAAGSSITWLRIKDGKGWVHENDDFGQTVMMADSLRNRRKKAPRLVSATTESEERAYNTIVARLFHKDLPDV